MSIKNSSTAIKLISFQCLRTGLSPRLGLLLPDMSAIDLSQSNLFSPNDSMLTLIQQYSPTMKSNFLKLLQNTSSSTILTPKQYKLLAPIPYPKRNLFCVGKNYLDHVQETSNSAEPVAKPKYPQFFTKVPETVIGPNDLIPSHKVTTKWLDYEAELAIVIGKKGCNISPNDAYSHIFGYTIANDISARDIQKRYVQFMKGKCLDSTCPLGPYIALHDHDHDHNQESNNPPLNPQNLSIKLWINNELRQNSNTNQMIFHIPDIISHLSLGMTLYPGDIILTGTPAGVGFAMSPPQVLKTNDEITIEIEGLGRLENTIGE